MKHTYMKFFTTLLFLAVMITPLSLIETKASAAVDVKIDRTTEWRYFDDNVNLLNTFYQPSFNDSAWQTGIAPFGYGMVNYPDITTSVPSGDRFNRHPVTYYRTTFDLDDLDFLWAEASIRFDDGAVVFLNGEIIYRANVPEGPLSYTYTPYLVDIMEGYDAFTLDNEHFVLGENQIAIAVYNNSATSNDLYLDFNLSVHTGGEVPDYFGPERITVTFYEDVYTEKAFNWFTNPVATNTHIEFMEKTSETPDFSQATQTDGFNYDFDGYRVHRVLLEDLEPGTQYWYRVGDRRLNMWSDPATFETMAYDEPFEFIRMTDTHTADERTGWLLNSSLTGAFDNFPNAKFLMHGGDFVDFASNVSEWQYTLDLNKSFFMNFTTLPTAGNHDGQDRWTEVDEYFSNTFYLNEQHNPDRRTGIYYSIDFGHLHVAVMNSEDTINQQISPDQMAWLRNDLENATAPWKVVMAHRGIYTGTERFLGDSTMTNMRAQLVPLFDEMGVDVYFFGHDHIFYRSYPMVAGEAQDYFILTEEVGGVTNTYHVHSDGTVYFINNAGTTAKFYDLDPRVSPEDINAAVLDAFTVAVFSHITVDRYKMTINSYRVNDNTQAITLYDSYTMYKAFDHIEARIEALDPATLTLEDEDEFITLQAMINQIPAGQANTIPNLGQMIIIEQRLETLREDDDDDVNGEDPDDPQIPGDQESTPLAVVIGAFAGVAAIGITTTFFIKKRRS